MKEGPTTALAVTWIEIGGDGVIAPISSQASVSPSLRERRGGTKDDGRSRWRRTKLFFLSEDVTSFVFDRSMLLAARFAIAEDSA